MIEFLKVTNFAAGVDVPNTVPDDAFVIKTCQRSLVLHYSDLQCSKSIFGQDAYFFLLEIICGLQSKLIGENEIVGQFKAAYHEYISKNERSPKLLQILEKLFKDAKEIRREYLMGICQKTYASISRRSIMKINDNQPVVILGSGNLAEDLINQFKKKTRVIICARNKERVRQLSELHDLEVIPWEQKEDIINYPFIANIIGCDRVLFDHDFFTAWALKHDKKLFVDLASPSPIETSYELNDGVMHLEDIFKEGAVRESKKRNQIKTARAAIKDITVKRHRLFKEKAKNDNHFKSQNYDQKITNL